MDASIFVRSDARVKTWTIVKAKDAADGVGHPFNLIPYKVRENQWGRDKTSCAVAPSSSAVIADEIEARDANALWEYLAEEYRKGSVWKPEDIRAKKHPSGMTCTTARFQTGLLIQKGRLEERKEGRVTYLYPVGVPLEFEEKGGPNEA